jgi:hypothetical protein
MHFFLFVSLMLEFSTPDGELHNTYLIVFFDVLLQFMGRRDSAFRICSPALTPLSTCGHHPSSFEFKPSLLFLPLFIHNS